MQVFNLKKLRGVNSEQKFVADAIYTGVGSCHNIVINPDKGVAYLVGCRSKNGGGPIFVDISDPKNPVSLGDYTAEGYSHDAQVVTYKGPDTTYQGKEIYIGSNESDIVILDVTDKNNVVHIATINYAQAAYTHQGWFTEDHRYFILGDELDEYRYGMNTRTLIFDLQDLDNPVLSSTYFGKSKAIDHNGYVKGNEFFLSSYTAGMRVFDISNISSADKPMVETGFFDTRPRNNRTSFKGVWSVYPYFSSGNIVISDINRGMFIVKKQNTKRSNSSNLTEDLVKIYPNPTNSIVSVSLSKSKINTITISNIFGSELRSFKNIDSEVFEIDTYNFSKGVYLMKINNSTVKKLIIN